MTKQTITKERVAQIANPDEWVKCAHEEVQELARMVLATMGSEPVAWTNSDALADVYCGITSMMGPVDTVGDIPLYRHAQQEPDVGVYTELYQLREVVKGPDGFDTWKDAAIAERKARVELEKEFQREVTPLYRHAQPVPVVPDDVLEALQKVARIRLDLNEFDGDRRGIADCLCDAEEALIEVVNRRAAMLAAAPQEVK